MSSGDEPDRASSVQEPPDFPPSPSRTSVVPLPPASHEQLTDVSSSTATLDVSIGGGVGTGSTTARPPSSDTGDPTDTAAGAVPSPAASLQLSPSPPPSSSAPPRILSLSLNQDGSCLACGTTDGFRIHSLHPTRETFRRHFGAGVAHVQMLFRCNLLALVGSDAGGPGAPHTHPPNKVMVWDDHRSACIGELSFRGRVLAVRLRRDRVAVALATRVYVYRFSDLALLDQVNTVANPRGLLCLGPDPRNTVLACPSIARGHVRVELYSARKSTLVAAHDGPLAALALTSDGHRLATASDRGTLVRVFDCRTGDRTHELRRGAERADISCLSFDGGPGEWLACCSDKGTVHIFSLNGQGTRTAADGLSPAKEEKQLEKQTSNRKITGAGLGLVNRLLTKTTGVKYFGSEWSHAQVRGIEDPVLCTFRCGQNFARGSATEENTIVVVGRDGGVTVADFSGGG
eukprot:CAMPEP_0194305820 /NCGR_PEP_ID=MMETSP0171-20130528/3161_1 /TAXON_ID=218684 /ORGANISM="Corethron pennatum, Strain L29A3" /LENGTH=459 /DNA_ID=CAMNT_0039057457 /DNA_START=71 /DNA_END=1446 /DNA_ORIENTATION=+